MPVKARTLDKLLMQYLWGELTRPLQMVEAAMLPAQSWGHKGAGARRVTVHWQGPDQEYGRHMPLSAC